MLLTITAGLVGDASASCVTVPVLAAPCQAHISNLGAKLNVFPNHVFPKVARTLGFPQPNVFPKVARTANA